MTDRISQEAYRALTQKQTGTGRSLAEISEAALQAASERAVRNARKPQARGRFTRHKSGEMNKTEAAYAADVLEQRKQAGEIVSYWFERFTFKLADDCRYTPDFVVMLASGELECHETKGFWADDAKVKIRVAASLFPFRFVAIQKQSKKDGGQWVYQEF